MPKVYNIEMNEKTGLPEEVIPIRKGTKRVKCICGLSMYEHNHRNHLKTQRHFDRYNHIKIIKKKII